MNQQLIQDEGSYRAALHRKDCYLLILGESGFDCYLSCPTSLIQAEFGAICLLMHDLEALSWGGHLYQGDLADVSPAGYEANIECGEFQPGDRVAENGEITSGIWLLPQLQQLGIAGQVLDVLRGSVLRMTGTAMTRPQADL